MSSSRISCVFLALLGCVSISTGGRAIVYKMTLEIWQFPPNIVFKSCNSNLMKRVNWLLSKWNWLISEFKLKLNPLVFLACVTHIHITGWTMRSWKNRHSWSLFNSQTKQNFFFQNWFQPCDFKANNRSSLKLL